MANEKIIQQKHAMVETITEKLQASKSTIIVDYRGLNVEQVTKLRTQLREAGIEFKVYKNALTRRAADAAGLGDLKEYFVGPVAVAFSNEDVVAPAKILNEFAKGNEALEREQLKIQEDAQALLKGGYTPDEVYEIVEYDVPISTLRKMNRELRKEETER